MSNLEQVRSEKQRRDEEQRDDEERLRNTLAAAGIYGCSVIDPRDYPISNHLSMALSFVDRALDCARALDNEHGDVNNEEWEAGGLYCTYAKHNAAARQTYMANLDALRHTVINLMEEFGEVLG